MSVNFIKGLPKYALSNEVHRLKSFQSLSLRPVPTAAIGAIAAAASTSSSASFSAFALPCPRFMNKAAMITPATQSTPAIAPAALRLVALSGSSCFEKASAGSQKYSFFSLSSMHSSLESHSPQTCGEQATFGVGLAHDPKGVWTAAMLIFGGTVIVVVDVIVVVFFGSAIVHISPGQMLL